MLNKRDIIVLNTIKHSEQGMVVQCYSLQKGREAYYFKGGGKNKTILPLLHKLALLECVTYSGKTNTMASLKEIVSTIPLPNIRTNVYKSAIAIFVSELLLKTIKEEETNPGLFTLINSSIQMLDEIDKGSANFHLFFMVNLSRALGYMPYLSSKEVEEGGRFHIPSGKFHVLLNKVADDKSDCLNNEYFSKEESILMQKLLKSRVTDLQYLNCNGTLRYNLAGKMLSYLSYHLGCELQIKSLDVLHEVFI